MPRFLKRSMYKHIFTSQEFHLMLMSVVSCIEKGIHRYYRYQCIKSITSTCSWLRGTRRSWEKNFFSLLSYRPKRHYPLHKNPSLDPVFSRLNPINTLCFLRLDINIILSSRPDPASGFFSDFRNVAYISLLPWQLHVQPLPRFLDFFTIVKMFGDITNCELLTA